jgi:hypothetical protein
VMRIGKPDAPPEAAAVRADGRWSGARVDVGVLTLVGLLLYAPLIGWGLPVANGERRFGTFATDDILPLGPLAELRSTLIESQPDRNYGYPLWHYVVDAAAQAPYVVYLWLTGGLSNPTGTYPFGLADPVSALRTLTLIGRTVTVLMACGVVVCAYWFARIVWDRQTALAASALTSCNFLLVYYGRTGNVDVPAFFWIALGTVLFAAILRWGLTLRRVIGLGILAGLGMATKDQAFLAFLPIGIALLVPPVSRQEGMNRARTAAAGLGASMAAYLVATGMLVDPKRHIVHVGGLLFHPEWVTVADSAMIVRHAKTLEGLLGLAADYVIRLGDAMSWPVLAAAAGGAFVCRSPRVVRWAILIAPLLLLFWLLAFPTGFVVRRYFLPLTLIVDSFAACAMVALWRSKYRPVAVAAFMVLLAVRLSSMIDLSYAQVHDTRYAAAAWIGERARAGQRVEYFGARSAQPRVPADVLLRRLPEAIESTGVKSGTSSIAAYLRASRPDYVVVIPDFSAPDLPHSRDCPEEIYRGLLDGRLGYTLAAYFPPVSLLPDGWRPPLDYPTVAPPVRIFVPANPQAEWRDRATGWSS